MRWLYVLLALVPFLVGAVGSESRHELQQPDVTVKQDNAARNEGKNRCEDCGVETVQAEQHKKGVTPPKNEAHVDHIVPRAKGGPSEPDNGQVLCRECNIKKSDKDP